MKRVFSVLRHIRKASQTFFNSCSYASCLSALVTEDRFSASYLSRSAPFIPSCLWRKARLEGWQGENAPFLPLTFGIPSSSGHSRIDALRWILSSSFPRHMSSWFQGLCRMVAPILKIFWMCGISVARSHKSGKLCREYPKVMCAPRYRIWIIAKWYQTSELDFQDRNSR